MRTRSRQQEMATEGTGYRVEPYNSRAYALYEEATGDLVGVFVYLKGAAYVAKKLAQLESALAQAMQATQAIKEGE